MSISFSALYTKSRKGRRLTDLGTEGAELHFLHARLQGGKLNKAKKGELRFPLPVGFCYDEESRIILDPDEEVRGAVGWVFRLFRETGTACAVMQ
jgi:hypothetical protein